MASKGLPVKLLQAYGCKSPCVWKGTAMCPYSFTKAEETTEEGYCDDLLQLLESFRAEGESLSMMKEKFFLYTQELQASADWGEFKELQIKLKNEQMGLAIMQSSLASGVAVATKEELQVQRSKVAEIMMALRMSKEWWMRLSDSVAKGHGRINDREKRSEDVKNTGAKITVQQLNVLMKDADALLLGESKKDEEDVV